MRNAIFLVILVYLAGCQWQEPKSAYGTIEREVVLVNAAATADVTEVPVSKGQRVTSGQLLVQQDKTELIWQQQQVQAELAAAQAQLDLMQAGSRQEQQALARANLAAADARLADAKLTLQRQAELSRQGLNSAAAVQQADAALAVAQAERQAYAEQLAQTLAGNRPQEIETARQKVQQLTARLQQLLWQINQRSIYAKRSGVIDDVLRYVGEHVTAGSTLITMAVDNSAYARIYLPAEAVAHWQVGSDVSLWLDGREAPVNGTIRYISSAAAFTPHFALHQQERSRLVYLAEISLPDSATLRTGTPIRLELP